MRREEPPTAAALDGPGCLDVGIRGARVSSAVGKKAICEHNCTSNNPPFAKFTPP
jgi:hypothetical protein